MHAYFFFHSNFHFHFPLGVLARCHMADPTSDDVRSKTVPRSLVQRRSSGGRENDESNLEPEQQAGFVRPSLQLRRAAATVQMTDNGAMTKANNRKKRKAEEAVDHGSAAGSAANIGGPTSSISPHGVPSSDSLWPAPLVLPGDDLDLDPTYPAQSLTDFSEDPDRNAVTHQGRTLYIAPPPIIDESLQRIMAPWSTPRVGKRKPATTSSSASTSSSAPLFPSLHEIAEYVAAFYHPLPVKALPACRFVAWEESKSNAAPRFVGLVLPSNEVVRIRVRACADGAYDRQLNLNDLIDGFISLLPADAYALVAVIAQDMFEGKDDAFCCGRAYGGSRVAVISTARYHPDLDTRMGVDRDDVWPASHFRKRESQQTQSGSAATTPVMPSQSQPPALIAAQQAHVALPAISAACSSSSTLSGLWLSRVCKTVCHELGHCFGIDHCIYYACSMQGTAHLSEDARQPPYLCPVDMAKLEYAIGNRESRASYASIDKFCSKPSHGSIHLFAAFAAWIREMLQSGPARTPSVASTPETSTAAVAATTSAARPSTQDSGKESSRHVIKRAKSETQER